VLVRVRVYMEVQISQNTEPIFCFLRKSYVFLESTNDELLLQEGHLN